MKDDHKKDQQIFQSFAMVMQFGINMLVPIFACTLFGAWLGDKLNISWLALPFFAVGALAGMRNVFLFARRIYQPNDKKTAKRDTTKQEKERSDV
jgi:dipeptide/tripeptide permease